MRRLLTLLAVGTALVLAPTVNAGGPVIVHQDLTDSFVVNDLCSFDVTITLSGVATIKLWLNSSGLVTQELDTIPGGTISYASATRSFSFPANLVSHSDYGSGAVLGGSAEVVLTGLQGHVPGQLQSDAGLLSGTAEVVDFATVEGAQVPQTLFTDFGKSVGHRNSGDAVDAAICAALS
jgi:hypothetical protein